MLSAGEVPQLCGQRDSAASMWKSHQRWVPRGHGDGVVLSVGLSGVEGGVDEGKGKMMPSERVAVDAIELHVHFVMGESGHVLRSKGQ